MNPSQLPDNYRAVKGVLMSTLRRLNNEPHWKQIYGSQIVDMLDRKAARKLSDRNATMDRACVVYCTPDCSNPIEQDHAM